METKFKVGDKVRLKNEGLYLFYYPGIFIINSVRICPDSNYYDIMSELNGAKSYYWHEDRLELVPPEPEFKVGDRVVTMYGTYTIPPSHGEGFAVGWSVVDETGKEESFGCAYCDHETAEGTPEDREWVKANVALPSVPTGKSRDEDGSKAQTIVAYKAMDKNFQKGVR